jgi:hypothetical protein
MLAQSGDEPRVTGNEKFLETRNSQLVPHVILFLSPTQTDMISAMRRAWTIPLVLLLLSGCGTRGSSTASCDQLYWNEDLKLGTCLPTGWKALSSTVLRDQGAPEETVAAFQSTEPRDGQFDTVTVTKEPLAQEMGSSDYGEANVVAVSVLPDYQRRDKQDIKIDGNAAIIHVFSARPIADKPIRRYYQLSVTREKEGFTFTGSMPLAIDDASEAQVLTILKNVTFTSQQSSSAK